MMGGTDGVIADRPAFAPCVDPITDKSDDNVSGFGNAPSVSIRSHAARSNVSPLPFLPIRVKRFKHFGTELLAVSFVNRRPGGNGDIERRVQIVGGEFPD
jgi:hypothetical protein